MSKQERWGHLVIGTGIAGLSLALKLAKLGRVLVIAKDRLAESNTRYAQGGIATVLSADDSFEQHIADTMAAGAGLCHEETVRRVVSEGPARIAELVDLGVQFTLDQGGKKSSFHLTQEGGHQTRRVIHVDDATGAEIVRVLLQRVKDESNIEIRGDQMAVNLLTTDKYAPTFSSNECLGAYILDCASGEVQVVRAERTYLCTGGHGKVYQFTSNPDLATGDGLAMGWRAGCRVANLEFMQFHPTCLFHASETKFLISEALRGEGAVLRNQEGQDFVKAVDPRGSLAPRDIVARAIDHEMKTSGSTHVFLDASALGDEVVTRFPAISARLLELGIDPRKQWIPVVPAAHYSCGGLVVDADGETTLKNLFAIGEVACSGLHGANRLASNSLLEALVFSEFVYQRVVGEGKLGFRNVSIPPWQRSEATRDDELSLLPAAWDEIRRLMWNYVGIVRSDRRLQRAERRIHVLIEEIDSYYWENRLTKEILELRNLAQVANLTIRGARTRKESRGIHYNIDYPQTSEWWKRDSILF